MMTTAHPILSSAAASNHGAASPSLELLEARQLRDALKLLLRKERAAMAEFLVALADFDRRRGWEPLGHANLFAFLVADLRLSKSAAYYRKSSAELLQRFPEVIEPLREGKLCLSTVGELAKVLTAENEAIVTPRFFGLSSREAQELVAELLPRPVPSTRMVVTRVPDRTVAYSAVTASGIAAPQLLTLALAAPSDPSDPSASVAPSAPSAPATCVDPSVVPPWRFPTSGIAFGGGAEEDIGRLLANRDEVVPLIAKRDEIVPLTANVRRIHFNVDKEVVRKLKAAREGLSRSIRGATMEQVLEAALDLLLEKQAKVRGQVKRPRAVRPTAAAMDTSTGAAMAAVTATVGPAGTEAPNSSATGPASGPASGPSPAPGEITSIETPLSHSSSGRPEERDFATDPSIAAPTHRRDGPREAIPAAVRRAVWDRDAGRCSWPLDGGGCCGSTHRLELDHVVPWAKWGDSTEENLRVICGRHNRLAARRAFGERCVGRYGRRPG